MYSSSYKYKLNNLINVKNPLLGVHSVEWILHVHLLTLTLRLTFGVFDLVSHVCLQLDLLLAPAIAGACLNVNA